MSEWISYLPKNTGCRNSETIFGLTIGFSWSVLVLLTALFLECAVPLGVENWYIPDYAITASSEVSDI